jgi:hypothetical protein
MVTRTKNKLAVERGYLMAELLVAMAILVAVILPVAYSFTQEKRVARGYYDRAVAMEIVDGEMEVLMAGEWRTFAPGQYAYPVNENAVTNLPPGKFTLTIQTNKVRLEWKPDNNGHGGPVAREATAR